MQQPLRFAPLASLALLTACSAASTPASPELAQRSSALSVAEPNDPYFADQWQLHAGGPFTTADGKGQIEGGDHAHVAEAWGLILSLGLAESIEDIGSDVRLAVIDDGFDLDHEELAGKIVASKNFGGPVESGTLFSNGSPADFHGMLVTGIAAARANNGKGLAGACPGCELVLARMSADSAPYADSSEDYYDEIFDWLLAQDVDVVNASWGPDRDADGARLEAIVERARSDGRGGKGTALVFASGNSGEDFAWNGFASSDLTISVGGTNSTALRYDFSNYGVGLDVMAPTSGAEKRSSGFSSLYIDRIWTTDNHLDPACLDPGETPSSGCSDNAGWTPTRNMAGGDAWNGRYSYRFSHTSAAAPLVSGIVGLVLHVNPALTSEEVRDILAATADKVSPDDAGYDDDGVSETYGHGRVNALRAVAFAHLYGGGTLDEDVRAEIDALSPCTRTDCWDLSGAPPAPVGDDGSAPGEDGDDDAPATDAGDDAGAADDGSASDGGDASDAASDGAEGAAGPTTPGMSTVESAGGGCSVSTRAGHTSTWTLAWGALAFALARRRRRARQA